MDLQNVLPHKRNTKVLVDGTVYDLDEQGVVRGMKKEHAEKLLQNRQVWRIFTERKPVEGKKSKKAAEAQKAPEKVESPSEAPEVSEEPLEALTDDSGDSEGDSGSEDEWPDPEDSMPIEYLREMAEAYEVKFTERTSAATLVKRIKKAMYPDEG